MYKYTEVYNDLCFSAAVVSFFKKDGTLRTMLCTRNNAIADVCCGVGTHGLGGHDKRCNVSNGNLAVIDLIIGEARSFNIDRVLHIECINEPITNKEEFEKATQKFIDVRDFYSQKINGDSLFDSLDTTSENSGVPKYNEGDSDVTDNTENNVSAENTGSASETEDIDINALFAQ